MRSIVLVVLIAAASCMQQHSAADQAALTCATCHLPLYNARPDHVGQKPTTCGDCHNTRDWSEVDHPESQFPIQSGPHQGIACTDCHDASLGSPVKGANTNCLRCHLQGDIDPSHTGIPGYAYDPGKPSFCLACHPDGLGPRHPETAFPIQAGPHSGIACADCHDRSAGRDAGGANTDCIHCHTGIHAQAIMTEKHSQVGGFVWQESMPHFCLSCHPDGYNRN